jgi:pyridinium-3,5-bisthiocarboxylic acid mononucleotide nickel chelatase
MKEHIKGERHNLKIEFNVDDMNPLHIPYLLERLLTAGASDAFITPIIMKKGRPGYLFTITCCETSERKVLEVIFSESTTLGVRKSLISGIRLERKIYKTNSSFGEIQVKEITMPSGEKRIVPEYDECRKIAETKNIPLNEVREKLLRQLNQEERLMPVSNN